MFPDFPRAKERLQRLLIVWIQRQVPRAEPLLADVRAFRQHEGRAAVLKRSDASSDGIDYQPVQFSTLIAVDDVRNFNLQALQQKLLAMVEEMAQKQTEMLLAGASRAAESVGNTVKAGGDLQPEHFLDLLRKIRMDFDATTGEPRYPTLVVHPSQLPTIQAKMTEWDADPRLVEEKRKIIEAKREEWRAREDNRKLVD